MDTTKKSSTSKTLLTIVISITIAVFFMWLAFRGLDFEKIKSYFQKANYFWVLVASVFGMLAYWFRAVRWNLLFEPLGYKISTSNAFWTISFGYLMNLTIPRSGELARASALYGVEKVPVDKSFGTIILERIVDLICMIGFLGLTLLFKYDAIVAFVKHATGSKQEKKETPGVLDLILQKMGVQDLSSFYFYAKIVLGMLAVAAIAYIIKYKRKNVSTFVKGLFEGVMSIFKLQHPWKFIWFSILIWVCYFFAAYLVCFALPETQNFTIADGFFIIVVGTFGMMIPASGGIGAFHFVIKIGIGALFLSMGKSYSEGEEVGLAYAFISHTMQLAIMAVLGFISIPMLAKARALVVKDRSFE